MTRSEPVSDSELSPNEISTAVTPGGTGGSAGSVARWAIHRRLYNWVLSLAHTKHATWSLFMLSFSESSFFPIPPDVLLGPLCLGHRKKSMWFATVTTVASVLGAILGYYIGHSAWSACHEFMFNYVPGFTQEKFDLVENWYEQWGVLVLFIAAFTPIPFKIFTIAGGVFAQPLLPFVAISIVGRGARFFLVAGLFRLIGTKATPFIDKYFNWLCLAFVVLLIGGFSILKLLH